jgi:site-specific recombinase XerD
MDLVETIKPDKLVKLPFSDEEVVALKDSCKELRDKAMVDFLNSSMIRVGELVKLNRDDIFFGERECVVFGKGRKERIAYFDSSAKMHLEEYLKARTDSSPALFVSLGEKANRLSVKGVQTRLKLIGKQANVTKVHPHRFRRTGATRCLIKGVPLDILQELMGHSDIKTTQIYAKNNKQTIKSYFTRVYM